MAIDTTQFTRAPIRPSNAPSPAPGTQPPQPGDLNQLTSHLTGAQRDAFAALNAIFTQFGLGTLAPAIANFIRQGYSSDTISLLLQDTPEYKQRFAANAVRLKKGLPVLSPAQYLATEQSYRQIMRSAGLPPGFYDNVNDFQTFLENDVAPQELQQRVTDARNFIDTADAEQKKYFEQFYSRGDMIAYALDPNRAAPLIGKQLNAALIAGQAADHNMAIDRAMAERMADRKSTR